MGLNMDAFGMGAGGFNIFDKDEEAQNGQAQAQPKAPAAPAHTESEFVLKKKITCPVCGKLFIALVPLSTRLRRLEPEFDLRPRFEYIDTLKYDVISCPHCGYAAMSSVFATIDTARSKLIKQEISANFAPEKIVDMDVYTYEYAFDRYKLALVNTVKKRGKLAERAYCCLKMAWLRRAQMDALVASGGEDSSKHIELKADYDHFYKQAYEGFLKSLETEMPPYCGLDVNTVEFMLANMAVYFNKVQVATRILGKLLQNPALNNRMKDRCRDLKDELMSKNNIQE